MSLARPACTPRMSPTEMRIDEWHENPVALALIVVGAEPVELAVEGDIERIAEAPGNDLQVRAEIVRPQHAAFPSPIILRVMISILVLTFLENARRRHVGRT